jgi:hypothetical protein
LPRFSALYMLFCGCIGGVPASERLRAGSWTQGRTGQGGQAPACGLRADCRRCTAGTTHQSISENRDAHLQGRRAGRA